MKLYQKLLKNIFNEKTPSAHITAKIYLTKIPPIEREILKI